MSALEIPLPSQNEVLHNVVSEVIDSIAPSWPLDRMIAVNPYWGRIQQPFEVAAAELATIAGSSMTLPINEYRDAWLRGDINIEDLTDSLAESRSNWNPSQLIAELDKVHSLPLPLPLLSDSLDRKRDLHCKPAWCDTITHQVSQFCAAYFDRDQADWHPDQGSHLFGSWRNSLIRDHSVALLMHTPQISARARNLCDEPEQQIAASLQQLAIPEHEWADYLHALMMRVSGWASWCAYRRWQARLDKTDDSTLVDILAIRLSWETLLDDGERGTGSTWSTWMRDWQRRKTGFDRPSLDLRHIWQRAQEINFQRKLRQQLHAAPGSESRAPIENDAKPAAALPTVQAAFCIDVRSEVFRRHFEAQSQDISTLGFAGFFGLPISYTPLGTSATRPQLPGLLAPELTIGDRSGDTERDCRIISSRASKLRRMSGWRLFKSVPLSTFTLVETLGLGYMKDLVSRTLPGRSATESVDQMGLGKKDTQALRPTLDESAAGGVDGLVEIASKVLRGMGLDKQFARTVLLLGHGSQNRNNPHRAGLDCGACCGQTGEVNARALAGLLNAPKVRERLAESGINIPATTRVIAGLHNTTTDEVQMFDLDQLPAGHAEDVERLKTQLAAAGASARRERAPDLGLDVWVDKPQRLLRAVRKNADDWSQTRPEWGLANNAAFVIAPRERTRGVDLQGRSFLHDYDFRRDTDGSLLEQIMTAPMIVTNWINMQYYASTVDHQHFGSGNKTLHNVVGGRIGVFEGNGGDLRIGLPWQSLNDGERWLHTPLRLTVVIEAPREFIERVIARHENVRQLVHNQWLYLMRVEGELMERFHNGGWHDWTG